MTWRSADKQLPAFAWRDYGSVLASHAPQDVWRLVAIAYREANEANWHVIELEREFESAGPIHFIDFEWLREPFRSVWFAMEALERFSGPNAGVFAYTGHAELDDVEAKYFPPPRTDMPAVLTMVTPGVRSGSRACGGTLRNRTTKRDGRTRWNSAERSRRLAMQNSKLLQTGIFSSRA